MWITKAARNVLVLGRYWGGCAGAAGGLEKKRLGINTTHSNREWAASTSAQCNNRIEMRRAWWSRVWQKEKGPDEKRTCKRSK